MSYLVCEAEDCKQPFEPAVGQEETQRFCSVKCRNRVRVRRWRERHKAHPNGGGPGGKRQARLFPRAELHRRKPAKFVVKPKQDPLFPVDGDGLFATQAGGVEYATGVNGDVQVTCYRTLHGGRAAL